MSSLLDAILGGLIVKDGNANTKDISGALLQGIEDGSGVPKTIPSDILPLMFADVVLPVNELAPVAGEVTEIDVAAAKTNQGASIDATAIVITCSGDAAFEGIHATINSTSTTTAATDLLIDGSTHAPSFLCPPGLTLIPYNEVISKFHFVGQGSAVNRVQVSFI